MLTLTVEYVTNLIKIITMQFILTCENGKQIDMSSDVLKQMEGEITREDVQERIAFYQLTNKK